MTSGKVQRFPGGLHVHQPRGGFYPNTLNEAHCVASVADGGRSVSCHQCVRKWVNEEHGHRWCKQHTPSAVVAAVGKREERWAKSQKAEARKRQHDRRDELRRMLDTLRVAIKDSAARRRVAAHYSKRIKALDMELEQ